MDDIWEGIVGLIGVGVMIFIGVYVYQHYIDEPFKEVSGVVSYYDCRQKVTLNSTENKNGTFICNDLKTDSGKSMGGECVKTTIDNSGKCQTAYIYKKPADETCGINSSLTTDDMCSCNYGYVMKGGSCISYNQDCQNSFGINSYGVSGNTTNSSTCYCNAGSTWSADKTTCISQNTLNQQCIVSYGTGSYSTTENGKNVCDCSYGYKWNEQRNLCVITDNKRCENIYGSNSYFSWKNSDGSLICGCKDGYRWNSNKTFCQL